MNAQKNNQNTTSKKRHKKWWLLILSTVVALLFILILLIPVIISSETARHAILAKINDSAPGRFDFADLTMGWHKGVTVSDIQYDDDTEGINIKVKQLSTNPKFTSLLLGNVALGKTLIDEPLISIHLKEKVPSERQIPAPDKTRSQPIVLPVHTMDLNINNGRIEITDPKGNTSTLDQINSTLNLKPPGRRTNLNMAMNLQSRNQQTQITAQAQLTPDKKTGWTLEGTSGDITIEIQQLDLSSLEPFFALSGKGIEATGALSANLKSTIEHGLPQTINGTVKGKNLEITARQLKGDKITTSDLNVDIQMQKENEIISIQNCVLHTDWADVTASGSIPTTVDSLTGVLQPNSQLDLKGTCNVNLADILSQLPRTIGIKEGMTVSSGKLNADFEAAQGKLTSTASLADLAGQIEGRTIALSQPLTLETAITVNDSFISFEKASLSSSFASMNLTGTTRQADYNANVNLSGLQSELGQFVNLGDYTFNGQIASSGRITTAQDKISIDSLSSIKNLQVTIPQKPVLREPEASIDLSLNYDTATRDIKINNADIDTSFAQINTQQASLSLAETQPAVNVPLALKTDLQKLQPLLVLFAPFPQQMQLAGIAESNISLTSQNNTYKIYTDDTTITGLQVNYPGKQPFTQDQVSLALDAELNAAQKTANVKTFRLQSPQIKIQGDFQQTQTGDTASVKGKADLEYDWAAVTTVAAPYLPAGLDIQGKRKDTVTFDSQYPAKQPEKMPANLNAQGKIGFDKASYTGLNIDAAELNINAQKGILKIDVPPTTANNGKLAFSGELDLTQTPPLFRISESADILKDVEVNDQLSKSILTYVNPIFANSVNVSGVANFSCERIRLPLSSDHKNDIEIDGVIDVNNLRLKAAGLLDQILSVIGMDSFSQTLKIHQTKFNLNDGVLKYDPRMQIDIGSRPLFFTGSIGLDNSLAMDVALPITLEGKTIKVGEETPGKPIVLPLEGTVNRPRIDTSRLLQNQLKERLFEELDKIFK